MALENSQSTPQVPFDQFAPFPMKASVTPTVTPTATPTMTPPVVAPQPVAQTPQTPAQPPRPITQEEQIANAYYKDALGNAVSGKDPYNSVILSAPTTPTSVVSSAEKLYQDYITNQQNYQAKLLEAMTPSTQEANLVAKLNEQRINAMANQETALASGETSSFAGGEAQRVARNDAFKQMTLESQIQTLQNARKTSVDAINAILSSGDKSLTAMTKLEELRNNVSSVEKQAENQFFSLAAQYPDTNYAYDATKSAVENFKQLQQAITKSPSYKLEQSRQAKLASGSGESTPKTIEERRAQKIKSYSSVFVAGAMLGDVPVIDNNGFITPIAWKEAIASAPGDGIPRDEFIKTFGNLLFTDKDGNPDPQYGLTAKEKALISG